MGTESRNTRSSMKAISTRSGSKSPRSMGSKKVASVRIASPSESHASHRAVQDSLRKSGSKSPSVLKSPTRSSKSSGTKSPTPKSPKPKPMKKMQEILIPSDTESEWSNLNDSSVGNTKIPVQKNATFKGSKSFNSVMNALDDDDSFNFD